MILIFHIVDIYSGTVSEYYFSFRIYELINLLIQICKIAAYSQFSPPTRDDNG